MLLTDASRAVDLLHTMKDVQPDELALLVLGHECPDPKAGCNSISFPARGRNCGSQLLLAGCLHNLGGKQITLRQQGNVNVTLPDVLCCTFTVYADECDSERWAAYTQAPVKTVIAAFQGSGVEKVLSEPWGRKFTSKGRSSTPALADVIMFQARVDQKACDALLAHSGHNGVYIVPRRLDQTLVSGYSVVWLGASRAEAIKASLQVPGQLGLVRSKDRYGLRVPESRHDAVFQQLKPGQAVPAKVTVSKLFRMGPVPSGADASSIQEWAKGSSWSVKVLKALGPQHWLLGANEDPPLAYPAFNGQVVLVTKVQQKVVRAPVVQSGYLQSRPSAEQTRATGEDPWNLSDPWSKALPSFGSSISHASQASGSGPRQLAGPTEQRFQQQDSRIQALEESVKALTVKQEQNHSELVLQQNEDRKAHQTSVTGLREQLACLSHDFSKQLTTSVESLQTAQAQQRQQDAEWS